MVGGGIKFSTCPSVCTFARAYGHAGDGILRPACRQFLVISEVSIIVEVQVTVRGGGIKRYRDPSVCLSQPRCVAQLPSLSARWLPAAGRPPEMFGLRTRPRMDVDPPPVELPSAGDISSR